MDKEKLIDEFVEALGEQIKRGGQFKLEWLRPEYGRKYCRIVNGKTCGT